MLQKLKEIWLSEFINFVLLSQNLIEFIVEWLCQIILVYIIYNIISIFNIIRLYFLLKVAHFGEIGSAENSKQQCCFKFSVV